MSAGVPGGAGDVVPDALVADADAGRAQAIRGELARHGHEVLVVSHRDELLARLDDDVRLVVIAPTLGEDPATAVVEALRAAQRTAPTVVVVAGTQAELTPELTREVVELGAADVWELPDAVTAADVRLRLVLAEFYARLQAEHVRVGGEYAILRQALDLTGTGFVLTDPSLDDNPIVYVNDAFCVMTGYPAEEVLGRNCRFLQGDLGDVSAVATMREAVREERPIAVTVRNARKDGAAFDNEVHIAPVRDANGQVVRFVGVQIDVTQHREGRADRLALAEGSRRLAEAALRRTRFLSEASPRLDATLDRRAALDALALLAVPALGRACLVLTERDGTIRRDSVSGATPELEDALMALPEVREATASDPIHAAAAGTEPLALEPRDAARAIGADPDAAGPLAGLRGLAVPLPARGRTVGVLVILGQAEMAGDDAAMARDLASRAGLAVDNARLYEEQRLVAEQLQREILPSRGLRLPRAAVVTRYRAGGAGVRVGGDFFDAFPAADGGMLLAIGDVTGKGAPAAALATIARSTLRTAAMYETAPASVLGTLNVALIRHREETARGRFVTVAACRLDEVGADGLRATVCLAGHPQPLVQRAGGEVETVGDVGMLLGFVDELRVREVAVDLAPGDRLLLFTDGLSEGIDPGRTVAELVAEHGRGASLEALADALLAAAASGERADDVAICAVEVAGT